MHLSYALTFALALAPSLVSAALFPSNSLVKVIDEKGFKKAMKEQVRT
jgi:protein disulfide-isomerase A6